jgi:hypothetical protein
VAQSSLEPSKVLVWGRASADCKSYRASPYLVVQKLQAPLSVLLRALPTGNLSDKSCHSKSCASKRTVDNE